MIHIVEHPLSGRAARWENGREMLQNRGQYRKRDQRSWDSFRRPTRGKGYFLLACRVMGNR